MNAKIRVTQLHEGQRHTMTDGVHIVKADAEDTGGVYEVFVVDAVPGPPTPQHSSPWGGTVYVLEGAVSVQAGDEHYELTAGSTLTAPPHTPFSFTVTNEPTRLLAVTTGGGASRFFADFAASIPADGAFEEVMPKLLEVTERHGITLALPTP